jgi:hypothetical protein
LVARSSWRNRLTAAFPIIAALLVLVTPSYYAIFYKARPRDLKKDYERLAPYERLLRRPGATVVTAGYGGELCNYVGRGECQGLDYFTLRREAATTRSWSSVLESHGATLVYANEAVLNDPAGQDLAREAESLGWQIFALHDGEGQHWILLGKGGASGSRTPTLAGASGAALQSVGIPVVGDWTGDGTPKAGIFLEGKWYLEADRTSQVSLSKAIGWGQAGDTPMVGDWNGDGRTKIGVFRNGVWYLDLDGSHRLTPSKIVNWGKPGDIPILGDWNHSGTTKIGVVRSGTWILDLDGSHQLTANSRLSVRP